MKKHSAKKLRVFEAFAGIGAQATALKRLGANFEVVGISEWMVDAVICYDAINHAGEQAESIPNRELNFRIKKNVIKHR